MRGEGFKNVQFRIPTPLFEQFYKAFPEHGERSKVLERFVVHAVEERKEPRDFLREILEEVEEEICKG